MSRSFSGQESLFPGAISVKGKSTAWLSEVERVIDWSSIEAIVIKAHPSREGAPAYPALSMWKALLLRSWYGLTDEGLESALDDRLSFRRFCGFALDRPVPDHATFWRFRDALGKAELAEKAFEALQAQLDAKGLIVKRGTLIDATIIKAAARAPTPDEGTASTTDPEASWTKKGGVSTFGYKAHLALDEGSGLIRKLITTPAHVHDSRVGDELVRGDERAVYADKGYCSDPFRERLRERGIDPCVIRQARRNRPLSTADKYRNTLFASVRAAVERPFALLKGPYRLRRLPFFGLRRNHAQLQIAAFAINLKRALALIAQPQAMPRQRSA